MIRASLLVPAALLALPACLPRKVDPWDPEMRVTRRGPVLAEVPKAGDGRATLVASATPVEAARAPAPVVTAASGDLSIKRSVLRAAMDAGPQRFMVKVLLRPFFAGKRFAGWELERFYEGDARFTGLDLRRGDVVTRVNGLRIGRPDEFMRAWNDVRGAREIRVDYLRGAQKRVLRVPIVEDVPALARPGTPEPGGLGQPIDE